MLLWFHGLIFAWLGGKHLAGWRESKLKCWKGETMNPWAHFNSWKQLKSVSLVVLSEVFHEYFGLFQEKDLDKEANWSIWREYVFYWRAILSSTLLCSFLQNKRLELSNCCFKTVCRDIGEYILLQQSVKMLHFVSHQQLCTLIPKNR